MAADDALLVDQDNDDPATTPRGTVPSQAHDGTRRLRGRSAVSAREEASSLLLVAGSNSPVPAASTKDARDTLSARFVSATRH